MQGARSPREAPKRSGVIGLQRSDWKPRPSSTMSKQFEAGVATPYQSLGHDELREWRQFVPRLLSIAVIADRNVTLKLNTMLGREVSPSRLPMPSRPRSTTRAQRSLVPRGH